MELCNFLISNMKKNRTRSYNKRPVCLFKPENFVKGLRKCSYSFKWN